MPSNNIYPSLSKLLSTDKIPDNLGIVKTKIEEVFSKLFYKDLMVSSSVLKDRYFYNLSIVTNER